MTPYARSNSHIRIYWINHKGKTKQTTPLRESDRQHMIDYIRQKGGQTLYAVRWYRWKSYR